MVFFRFLHECVKREIQTETSKKLWAKFTGGTYNFLEQTANLTVKEMLDKKKGGPNSQNPIRRHLTGKFKAAMTNQGQVCLDSSYRFVPPNDGNGNFVQNLFLMGLILFDCSA